MKTSILVATLFALSTLPVVCVAQDDAEAAPVDPDEAIIQLDPNDPSLDPWSQLRDTADDAKREPGLVPIGRLRRPGVLSFFALPLAFFCAAAGIYAGRSQSGRSRCCVYGRTD